jgi:pyridoxamine 5'-phosphate oxidase
MSGSLADMRRSYGLGGLAEADLAPTWLEQFRAWLADALRAGLTEPNAMVLATASADGAPSARTVLLKGADERGFSLYTNLGSRKGRDAAANPRASLVFPWVDLQRQVVVAGRLEPVGDAESDAYFATRPRGSQIGAHASPQGEVIASRDALLAARDAVQRRHPEGTVIPRPRGWGGLRVVPSAVEFWQGRPDRLHDRLAFRRDGDGAWVVERLAP